MPKIEKVSLKDYEHLIKKGKQVVRKRHRRTTFQRDAYDVLCSVSELRRQQQYEGEIGYKYRDERWYIQLIGWNEEIGTFMSRGSAEDWAQQFLGRKY